MPEVSKCDHSVGYLDQREYTYIILKVLIRVISVLLWSCQLTGKKGSNIDSKTVYDILIKMRMLVTDSIL